LANTGEKKDESSQKCTFTNILFGMNNITEGPIIISQVSSFMGGDFLTCQKLRDQSNFMEGYCDFWYSMIDNVDHVDYEGSIGKEEDKEEPLSLLLSPPLPNPVSPQLNLTMTHQKKLYHYLGDVMIQTIISLHLYDNKNITMLCVTGFPKIPIFGEA
jgi:hypothetical protein